MSDETAREAYRDYYKKVELHWSLARGNQIIVSPLEFASIEGWYQQGIPLAVILHAIDIFIDKKKKAKRKRNYLLVHVDGTVKKCHREYITLHEGEGEEQDLLGSKMKALQRKLKKLARDEPQAAGLVDELLAGLDAVNLEDIVQFDDIDSQLQDLETRLIEWFRVRMAPDDLADLKADIDELLNEEEEPEFYAKLVNDAVRAQYNLPRLTLLG
ncbi:MAG: hypothetical protein QNK37_05525 [Acidobacteriota bacterium]|nr:hypothetical protein [Acidobacteriota bacterium]